MRKAQLVLLLLFTLNVFALFALEGLRFENITNKDGLSHNTIRYVMQDSRGFMWFSSVNGLDSYDGHKFVSFRPAFKENSLTENNIRRTVEDNNGRIWVQTTSRFVHCYDTNIEDFVDYIGNKEVRKYRRIEVLPNGEVWLYGNEQGACRIIYRNGVLTSTVYDINTIGTNVVASVLKDDSGQIWLGTNKGLIQLINNEPKFCNTEGKTHNYHSAIEQKERIFFFTNDREIVVYDKQRKWFLPTLDLNKWPVFKLNNVVALDENRILITGRQQILVLNTETSEVSDARSLFGGELVANAEVLESDKEDVWLHNESGNLWNYVRDTKQFRKYTLIPKEILSLIDLERFNIYHDSRGITWITTYGNGLFAIDESGEINHFTQENSNLKTNYLLAAYEDRTGNIWIGTENIGLVKIYLSENNHRQFFPNPDKTDSGNRTIRSIYEDRKTQDVWLGTKQGDIYVFDQALRQKNMFSLRQGIPYCMLQDPEGNMWIGTKGNGIAVIPPGHKPQDKPQFHRLSNTQNAGANNIYALLQDDKNRIWVGTLGGGLFLCELVDGEMKSTVFPALSSKQNQVRSMIQDSSGHIWVGGSNGIILFHPDSLMEDDSRFRSYHFDKNNKQSLNNNIIKALYEDSKQRVWVGTSGGGINLAEKDERGETVFRHYTLAEGLINDMVQAILEDDNHNLWISTENGISKFDPESQLFDNYSFHDNWESDLFCESSACKRSNGDLLFGSHNGMYIFSPSLMETQAASPSVTLTRLLVNGIPVTPNSTDSPLTESITKAKQIRLNDGQNSFSIEFSSLNFQEYLSNRYAYILENYDEEWNPATQYNVATYKNIPAGKYLFKVKNVNNPHYSDEIITQLEIVVVPPFWKSTKAFILYIILIAVLVVFAVQLIIKMNKLHNDVIIEKQLTDYRLRFFTNISHEFRTPLTIIQGTIEYMNAQKLPASIKKQVNVLDKSASKLLRLIDQLLEFRKLQNDKMDLRLEPTEVVGFLKDIYELFQDSAKKKHIKLSFSSNVDEKIILVDKGKVDKILFNLLSNAIKHTPDYGQVVVEAKIDEHSQRFILKVYDSGIGISPDKQDQLFVRFKQINYSSTGIGIGLNLSYELALSHKGEIHYEQSELGGACFIVTIPISESSYNKEDIVVQSNPQPEKKAKQIVVEEDFVEESIPEESEVTKKYKILLIEDDEEIRHFLRDQLGKYFTVSTASDGLKGWNAAIEEEFNLIICDVMMPGMDGFEVTRKLKSDIETSHIPVILLTAHSSIEHQLEGINVGADSYITKPFSIRYLVSRIIKLIEQREKLQYKFAHDPSELQTTICTSAKDNAFIEKIQKIIEKHMDNTDFSIDDFAKEASMGRTLFYKKIKGITNLSPNEYLRVVRIKKAAELLRTTDLNVSEIAYEVGFNNPDYFCKCFKNQYQMKPTQFRQDSAQNTTRAKD